MCVCEWQRLSTFLEQEFGIPRNLGCVDVTRGSIIRLWLEGDRNTEIQSSPRSIMAWLGDGRRRWPRAKYTVTFAGVLLVLGEADCDGPSGGSQHLFWQISGSTAQGQALDSPPAPTPSLTITMCSPHPNPAFCRCRPKTEFFPVQMVRGVAGDLTSTFSLMQRQWKMHC